MYNTGGVKLNFTTNEVMEMKWLVERQLKELECGNWFSNSKIASKLLNGNKSKRCDVLRGLLIKLNETF